MATDVTEQRLDPWVVLVYATETPLTVVGVCPSRAAADETAGQINALLRTLDPADEKARAEVHPVCDPATFWAGGR